MQRQNIFAGLFVGLVLGLVIAHSVSNLSAQNETPPRNATENINRYQIVMGEKYCFVLDSKEGTVWQKSLIQGAIETSRDFYQAKTPEIDRAG